MKKQIEGLTAVVQKVREKIGLYKSTPQLFAGYWSARRPKCEQRFEDLLIAHSTSDR